MPLNRNENDEQYAKLRNKLTNKVYGITPDLSTMMDSSDDVGFNFGGNSIQNTSGNGNIIDAKIRSGRKETDLETKFVETMEKLGERYVNSMPYNERTRLIRESNYMLTQMPQLHTTFLNLTKFILSPDNYSEDKIIQDIYLKTDSAFTQADIEAILEERGLYKHIKDCILASLEIGYRNIELMPLQDVANKLLDRIDGKTNKEAKQLIEGKMNNINGTRTPNIYASAQTNLDKYDVTFYGESENGTVSKTVIPGSFVRMYRECFTHGTIAQRNELSSVVYDAVDDALGLGKYNNTYELYAESYARPYNTNERQKRIEMMASQFFSESPYSVGHREYILSHMHNKLMGKNNYESFFTSQIDKTKAKSLRNATFYGEADDATNAEFKKALSELKKSAKSKRKARIKDMAGCYIQELDDERTHPVIVNKELIGVYHIDTYMDYALNKTQVHNINNVIGSSKISDSADYRDNPLVRKDIIEGLSNILKSHMDTNFITENRRILGSILKVLEEHDMYQSQFRVRFIPRKYLVPFQNEESNNGIGKSKLLYARIPILFWTLLQQDKMMTKLFYEKDKLAIKYKTTFAQSLFNDREDAMEIFTDLFPLPSELTDFTRVHQSMATIGRLLIPVDKGGNELFSIERIEGQKYDTSNDDFMKQLEDIIENIIGFPLSSLNQAEKSYDYATSIIAQDGRLTQMITDLQAHYQPMASELATKIARYETGEDDIYVDITFPAPKLLTSNISNDNAQKFNETVNNMINMYYGEESEIPSEKKLFIKREIVKELFPAYDHTDILEAIEEKWKAHKATFIDSLGANGGEE